MIRSLRHRGLAALWGHGSRAGMGPDLGTRIENRLSRLDQARAPADMAVLGFTFHHLRGSPIRYSVQANRPWCLTFEWEAGDALRIDLEQYH